MTKYILLQEDNAYGIVKQVEIVQNFQLWRDYQSEIMRVRNKLQREPET